MPSTTGGSVPWRQAAQIGHGQVGDVAQRRIRIGARLEVDLDQADAGQRARFAVVDIRAQGKESLKGVGDVGFDLLRRHAVVESRHHHHRHIDLGKQIDRHAGNVDHADQHDHQAQHDDEEGICERKLRHYCSPPSFSSAFMSMMPPDLLVRV